MFVNVLMDNLHCPIKSRYISYKDDIKPWIDHETKEKIKKRQNNFLLYRRGLMSREEYNRHRNTVTALIRNKRRDYYANKFTELKDNLKGTWKLINSVFKPYVKMASKVLVSGSLID